MGCKAMINHEKNARNFTTKRRLPAFGAALAERQKFLNIPLFSVICAGQGAWDRAKKWNASPSDACAVVWDGSPPSAVSWPVAECVCIVDWDTGPNAAQVVDLTSELLRSGAASVVVRPLFVDVNKPAWGYDETRDFGDRWVQVRERIQGYAGQRRVRNG